LAEGHCIPQVTIHDHDTLILDDSSREFVSLRFRSIELSSVAEIEFMDSNPSASDNWPKRGEVEIQIDVQPFKSCPSSIDQFDDAGEWNSPPD
jgi:hypothetical protein